MVQLPLYLFESGPFFQKNNGPNHSMTALEFAKAKNLGVLVNRPLNAAVGNQMLRLADFNFVVDKDPSPHLKVVRDLEVEFVAQIVPKIEISPGSVPAAEFFNLGRELANPQLKSITLDHWLHIEHQLVLPQVETLLTQLDSYFETRERDLWNSWRSRYGAEVNLLLDAIRNSSAKNSQAVSDGAAKKLDPFLPAEWKKESLSRKAMGVLLNTPGVSCVLNGMRTEPYVADSLGVMTLPSFEAKQAHFSHFRLTRPT